MATERVDLDNALKAAVQARGVSRGLEKADGSGQPAVMDRALANYTVNALQALYEACNALAADLPPAQREKVEKLLVRVQQARTGIMAEMM